MLILTEGIRTGVIQTNIDIQYNIMTPPADQAGQRRHGRGAMELHVGRRNDGHTDTTGNLAKHVVTPRASKKRYDAPDGSIYIDWKPPKVGVTTQKNRTRTECRREAGQNRAGIDSRTGTKHNKQPR